MGMTEDKRSTVMADFGISQTPAGFNGGAPNHVNPAFEGSTSNRGSMAMMPMGSSRMSSRQSANSFSLALTPQYCAPERLLPGSLSFEELLAADVYSYGVIVWVIYAQTEPFLGMTGDDVLDPIKDDPANARHEIPGWTDAVARDIIVRCWALKGGARPTFSDARDVLTAHYCGSEVGGDPAEVYGQH